MTVSEFQDLLRRKLGIPDLDPFELKYIVAAGRRELETRGNYYYMAASAPKDHTLVVSQQSYNITVSTSNGLGLTNYKDKRALFIQEVAGTQWIPVPIGNLQSSIEEKITTAAKPQSAVVDGDLLYFFPTPDAAYPIKLTYFDWTATPTDVTDTDELLTRWPDAVLYASVMFGKRYLTQGKDQATEWEAMMKEQIELLKKYTKARMGEMDTEISTSEAARILQASGGQQG